MIDLIFASNNHHKAAEIQAAIGDILHINTLEKAGITIDIPEPHDTLEANASEKSNTIFNLTGKSCFGEDTGLVVDVLNGEPGVKSARYAGEKKETNRNIDKLLQKMGNTINREARFITVISLKMPEGEFIFDGICEGKIGYEPAGTNGFGYDSVFTPLGSTKTFAQMTMEEKALYSHRKKATDKLVIFLQQMTITKIHATPKAKL